MLRTDEYVHTIRRSHICRQQSNDCQIWLLDTISVDYLLSSLFFHILTCFSGVDNLLLGPFARASSSNPAAGSMTLKFEIGFYLEFCSLVMGSDHVTSFPNVILHRAHMTRHSTALTLTWRSVRDDISESRRFIFMFCFLVHCLTHLFLCLPTLRSFFVAFSTPAARV